jgi:hypothetical protein
MASNSILCSNTGFTQSINFNSPPNLINVGDYWSAWNSTDPESAFRLCVKITTGTSDPSAFYTANTEYNDCYDCLVANYGVVTLKSCDGLSSVIIPVSEFGFIPISNGVYYFTYEDSRGRSFTNCWVSDIRGVQLLPKKSYDLLKLNTITTTPLSQATCRDCLSNNSLTYEVKRCTDSTTDYVTLINNSYIGHLISYSDDGINEYCGVVGSQSIAIPSHNFIFDYGSSRDVPCDTCLETASDKILIRSCTNFDTTEVVWASALFEHTDVSNLSTDDGCFEVVSATTEEVTINSFLNFDPQPGCEPCIECNGVIYSYTNCRGDVTGSIRSYQSLSSGTTFYNPAISECCVIDGTSSGYYDDTLFSVDTFTGCADCENNANITIWNASACTNSNTYSSFYVTTDDTTSPGDIVKLMWGSNEWICAGLINTVSSYSGGYTYYNTQDNGVGTTLRYDSCENCNSQGLIGVTLVNCDTNIEDFVSITLDNYLSIYNFGSLINYSVSNENGDCYTIVNLCPIPLNEPNFTPVEFYFNCSICIIDNTIYPRDAGPETLLCVEICGPSGTTVTQISPPHPVWTDGYGTSVTQLNMVTLGGPNGLNN